MGARLSAVAHCTVHEYMQHKEAIQLSISYYRSYKLHTNIVITKVFYDKDQMVMNLIKKGEE